MLKTNIEVDLPPMWKFLFILLMASVGLRAQDSAKVRFYIKGGESIFLRVNDKVIEGKNTITLPVGTNRIEIYSPKYQPFSEDFVLEKSDSTAYIKKLRLDPEFSAYLDRSTSYKRMVFWNRTAPLAVAGLGAILTPILWFELGPRHEEYIKSKFLNQHGALTDDIYQNVASQYQTVNTLFFTSAAMAIGGSALHLILRNKVRSAEKPIYRQQNPFTLDFFELSVNQQGQVIPQAGMTWNF